MRYLSQSFILLSLIGASKAHHFVKVIILAGLGLAGLWMVHTLAQDYTTIAGNGPTDGRTFEKRSIDSQTKLINWELVLARDPARCARSFICQLSAKDEGHLTAEEKTILRLTRHSTRSDSWTSKPLLEAMKNGENASNPNQCLKIYKFCPYTSDMMMSLMKMFGS